MAGPPSGKSIPCPNCGEFTSAIVPKNCEVVEEEAEADGKVWVNCRGCEEQFLAYYSIL